MMDLKIEMEYLCNYQELIMQIKILCMRPSENNYLTMLGRDITVVYLLMDRQGLAKVIPWWATARIEELCLFHVMKFSKELIRVRMKIKSIKFNFLCLKFIMKKFKIYSFLISPKNQLVVSKYVRASLEQFMSKV